ncbi:hypothetical protein TrCOL_g13203 [Triparma columacea]|uniref:Opine dehydrogenase domain-containing protein n=1 Tax=Triparma columacea TaxID=722753 RepID=A0A9W7L221_9STRA|nr:hypothetical protein TrCOL_g13203 [Triparma columacea]
MSIVGSPDATNVTITLVGGGNSTHCLAPLICAAGINYTCNILTRRPEDWAEVIEMTNEDQGWMRVDSIKGRPSIITSDPSLVIPQSDIVWFAGVPIHHNPALLSLIAPHLDSSRHVFIGSICCYGGFNWVVRSVLGPGNYTPFGTNLIPWCCGTKKYGREGVVFGAKRLLRIVTSEGKDRLRLKEVLYPVLRQPLGDTHFLASTLWPNNASLHPPILYGLFKDWDGSSPFPADTLPVYIYKELSKESAEAVCRMDDELVAIVKALRERFPDDPFLKHDFSMKECIMENYEEQVLDPSTTATCISTNAAFSQHKIPYTSLGPNLIVPTLAHKFFETDLPFGIITFKDIATMVGVPTPMMDELVMWNQRLIGKEYVTKGEDGVVRIEGKDKRECVCPTSMGIKVEDLIK